jgi:hypothetical protein
MKHTREEQYIVICLAYIDQKSDVKAGRALKRSRSWVKNTRERAENYLEGRLE